MQSDIAQAEELIAQGREDAAYGIAMRALRQNRDDVDALFLLGTLHAKAEQFTSAWLTFRRVHELNPADHRAVSNIGMSLEGLGFTDEARDWFMKAHHAYPKHANYAGNIGMTYLQECDYGTAERWARRALTLDPEHKGANTCVAFCALATGRWNEGWPKYEYAYGDKFRAKAEYGLPTWDGTSVGRVVVGGEQGIGDEIMYASVVPDLIERVGADNVVLDCDARLADLFHRSFPGAHVFGTRRAEKHWLPQLAPAYQINAATLAGLLRPSPAACPGTPFLVPRPEYVAMYRALVGAVSSKTYRVGLTWSGGLIGTGSKRRTAGVEALRPIIEANPDVTFVSLEYRPEARREIAESGLPVHHFHSVTGVGGNYDHTTALIATLDGVLGVDTAAHHCAGALGVPVLTLLHQRPTWIHGAYQGDRMSWYRSVRVYRQHDHEQWPGTVSRLMTKDANVLAHALRNS